MQLTHGGHVAPDTAVTVLRLAAGSGVNHIDTAWFYGAGTCNALIREALAPYPESLVVATKLGADNTADGGLVPAQRPEELRRQVDANLASLGTERLDMVYLRRLDFAPGIIAEGEQKVDIDDQLAELGALREAGKIHSIALSNVDADQVRHALPMGIEAVQNAYNLLDRETEPVLEACREHGIAWIPYIPLGSAFPGHRKVTEDATVLAVARELGATASQVGLAWLLAHYERTLLIPGTANAGHLAENLAAPDVELGPDAMARLDALTG
ncbi:aldo/keto reductase [Streptomyces acidiscabies]|uniref:aldo/keto reductase n=1 Tax=Streptomyces acidiscabies TaxID=42234 RepID=UPI000287B75A|nr:aldo/keto reductase [Streptomyces sp. LBUM 1476]MBZ3917225.1 aldo/keto reductase [Streptomyces acidiscabies]GAV45390.1 putative oxidoreductase YdbC [Streptomyces acidiscabies]